MDLLERQTPISARPASLVAVVPRVAGFVPSSRLHVDLTRNARSTELNPLGPNGSSDIVPLLLVELRLYVKPQI